MKWSTKGLLGFDVEQRDANEDPADAGTTLFVASTSAPDRAMDVVRQDWRLAAFRANPVILDNHNPMRVVGRAVSVTVPKTGDDAGKLMIRVKWHLSSPDPSIANVGIQHLEGIRRAGSVGFRSGKTTDRSKLPTDHEFYQVPIEIENAWGGRERYAGKLFEHPELLEFSSATVPMNPQATQRGADDIDFVVRSLAPELDLDAIVKAVAGSPAHLALLWAALCKLPELRRTIQTFHDLGPIPEPEDDFVHGVALALYRSKQS